MEIIPRILVVDDDPVVRRAVVQLLVQAGYAVTEADSGEAALTALAERKPDLVLLNVVMPDMGGLEICRRIKADATLADLMVVMVSGVVTQPDNQPGGLEFGPDSYIVRPIPNGEFVARIDGLLQLLRTESALVDSERRYSSLYASMSEAVALHQVIYDAEGQGVDYRFLDVNPAYERLMGLTHAELLGQLASTFYTSLTHLDTYCAVAGTGVPASFETYDRRLARYLRISVFSPERGQFATLATDISDRRRAEDRLRLYAERLRVLHVIDGTTLGAWSGEGIAKVALRHVREIVPCTTSVVGVFDLAAHEARILARDAEGEAGVQEGQRISLDGLPDIDALHRGRLIYVPDIAASSIAEDLTDSWAGAALADAGLRCYAATPLIAGGHLIGTLVLSSRQPGAFSPDDLDTLHAVGDQLAMALEQANLREQVERHATELEALIASRTAELERRTVQLQVAAEVARDATGATDLQELLSRTVDLIRERFGFYHAGIFMVDEGQETALLRAATGKAGQKMLAVGHGLKIGGKSIVGEVAATGRLYIASDVGEDATHFDNVLLPATRSELALPLKAGGRVIGVLDVQSTEARAFDQQDAQTLQILADQLGVAMERLRLFDRMQRALEERLHAVISNAPVILFAVDRDERVTLLEGKGLEALGVEPEVGVGTSVFEMAQVTAVLGANVRRALAGESIVSTAEIDDLAFDVWGSPVRDRLGEIVGMIGVATDVTERRRLEHRVRRQERLAAVGQLAGGIAHDFNNFLTTIILYSNLVHTHPDLPAELMPMIQTVIDESHRASTLVGQVLDFSRRSPMDIQTVDLVEFLDEALAILRTTLPEDIHLTTEIALETCWVRVDPTRIQQVVMNLAINARDAMPEGGELHIGLSREDVAAEQGAPAAGVPSGSWARLTVSDTGTGMTDEVRSHIFEPFYTTKGSKGTGLGLAQVYGIVEQHNGRVTVASELHQGTTFCVYLPVDLEGPTVPSLQVPSQDALRGHNETILFVEDEARISEVAREVLTSMGYRVLVAGNGLEALERYRASQESPSGGIDLVITDIVMPHLGGKALAQSLREIDPRARIMGITGYLPESPETLEEAGILEVVPKPFDLVAVTAAIRRILDAK